MSRTSATPGAWTGPPGPATTTGSPVATGRWTRDAPPSTATAAFAAPLPDAPSKAALLRPAKRYYFDHEMNGFWYPWSEQANGNHAGEFVRAWRHVHDRFTAAGASNVIWIWSPNVIGAPKDVNLSELYPGGDYVDWLGLGGYYRKPIPHKPATFDNTFGESLAALRALDDKPIMLTEIGCTETGGNKPAWVESLFEALATQHDIIGFSWFNQAVTAIPSARGCRSPTTGGSTPPPRRSPPSAPASPTQGTDRACQRMKRRRPEVGG